MARLRVRIELNRGGVGVPLHKLASVVDEFGETPWFHQHGCIEWAKPGDGTEMHEAKVEQLRSWGYAAEWISKEKLLELEPDIDPKRIGDAEIAFYAQDGWIDPLVYANAMIKAAQSLGATLRCGWAGCTSSPTSTGPSPPPSPARRATPSRCTAPAHSAIRRR